MKKTLVALAFAAIAAPAFAADTYTVDPRHTFPSFAISHFGYSMQQGRFDKTSGIIVLDKTAKTGSVDITIDAASIDTGLEELEKHLRNEDFFNVAKYPTITFKSDKLIFQGDRLTGVDGKLTLLGATRPVSLAVESFQCAPHPMLKKEVCGATATTTIKRSDFGMTKYLPLLGDEVKITIPVEAIKS